MAYSDFTFERAIADFQLKKKRAAICDPLTPIPPSDWLLGSLSRGRKLALPGGNEKTRSEFLVAPILIETTQEQNEQAEPVTLYSGRNLDVERESGLAGECDFLMGRGTDILTLQAPLLTVVEAKQHDIDAGLGQCIAQMVGIQRFNQNHSEATDSVFGCVTTGEIWQFLQLSGTEITIDSDRFYIRNVDEILGCLKQCINGGRAIA